ncbi:MAG: hypothetical protein K6U89_16020, partial [Chloroflexi bacterium]|nr:hypothetical protein [Chloroflexota bacterium]
LSSDVPLSFPAFLRACGTIDGISGPPRPTGHGMDKAGWQGMQERVLHILEYDKVRQHIRSFAATRLGQERLEQMRPLSSIAEAEAELAAVDEALQMLLRRGGVPFGGIRDIRPHLRKAAIGGVLAAEELGIPYEQVRAIVADTASLGYSDVTDGSRAEPYQALKGDQVRVVVRIPYENVRLTTVPFLDAVLGGEVLVPTPKGTRLALKIPPGTQNGRLIRLAGQGMPKLGNSSQRGDLYARVNVVLPTTLTPQQRALFEQLRALQTR